MSESTRRTESRAACTPRNMATLSVPQTVATNIVPITGQARSTFCVDCACVARPATIANATAATSSLLGCGKCRLPIEPHLVRWHREQHQQRQRHHHAVHHLEI